MAAEMTDIGLVQYCNTHSESPRALFSGVDVNRMLALAGHPEGFVTKVDDAAWFSLHDPMKMLCQLAESRLLAADVAVSS